MGPRSPWRLTLTRVSALWSAATASSEIAIPLVVSLVFAPRRVAWAINCASAGWIVGSPPQKWIALTPCSTSQSMRCIRRVSVGMGAIGRRQAKAAAGVAVSGNAEADCRREIKGHTRHAGTALDR